MNEAILMSASADNIDFYDTWLVLISVIWTRSMDTTSHVCIALLCLCL